jgi:hypothetical protein
MSSSFTASAPIATSAARKNAAGTVARANLLAMLAGETVGKLGLQVGQGCAELHDRAMVGVRVARGG